MIKSILTGVLAAIIATGVPVTQIQADTGKCIRTYKDNGISYSAVKTSTGDLWIVEGKVKKGKKVLIVFDDKGTEDIYDDEVIYLTKL